MATDERQKYNFLVALTRQLREANRDESSCSEEFVELLRKFLDLDEDDGGQSLVHTAQLAQLDDRVGKCEQWLAALETALESLETVVGALDGDDDEGPDEGDIDDDVGPEQPPVGGDSGGLRRGAVAVGSPERQQAVARRTVSTPREKRRLRGGTQ